MPIFVLTERLQQRQSEHLTLTTGNSWFKPERVIHRRYDFSTLQEPSVDTPGTFFSTLQERFIDISGTTFH